MSDNDFEWFVNDTLERFDGHQPEAKKRSITDLTPLEKWLLKEMYFESKVVENLIRKNEDF